jgi:hypothetical protein
LPLTCLIFADTRFQSPCLIVQYPLCFSSIPETDSLRGHETQSHKFIGHTIVVLVIDDVIRKYLLGNIRLVVIKDFI